MQKVCDGGVGDEDRLDQVSVGELEQKLCRAVRRPLLLRQRRGGDRQAARQFFAERAAEVGHGAKVGHAPAIDPLKDLAPVESRDVNGGEMCFDLVELQLSRVDAIGGRHGAIGYVAGSVIVLRGFGRIPACFCLELHVSSVVSFLFGSVACKSFHSKHLRSPD